MPSFDIIYYVLEQSDLINVIISYVLELNCYVHRIDRVLSSLIPLMVNTTQKISKPFMDLVLFKLSIWIHFNAVHRCKVFVHAMIRKDNCFFIPMDHFRYCE